VVLHYNQCTLLKKVAHISDTKYIIWQKQETNPNLRDCIHILYLLILSIWWMGASVICHAETKWTRTVFCLLCHSENCIQISSGNKHNAFLEVTLEDMKQVPFVAILCLQSISLPFTNGSSNVLNLASLASQSDNDTFPFII